MTTPRPSRLATFDYTGVARYFLTMCCRERHAHFRRAEVVRAMTVELLRTSEQRQFAVLAYTFMPDHFHGIVGLEAGGGSLLEPGGSLASIVGGFKSACTGRYRRLIADPDARLWHRSFYEHWIRGSEQLARIRRYILDNPRNCSRSRATRSGR